ncbi:hypothetical protein BGI33_02110 [Snodgrassella alvi]|uniref:Transposase n=1 Tax=Snodgrassella alvi TaxID=1196083 RepID=A0A2N9WVP3_9NEIS|nr:hypothetical protein BGI32_02560 [Snodgrassella alvi]PIT17818.1 hypothetical protein BGI33_02110 [Snodgrassella alvi]PIT21810.1 hypothetical protein BGI34_00965 [Snodgrassella alvi]
MAGKYGGMGTSDIKRIQELEAENRKLKQISGVRKKSSCYYCNELLAQATVLTIINLSYRMIQ